LRREGLIWHIAENELLQLELSHLDAGTSLNKAGIELEINKFQLRSFLNLGRITDIELIIPSEVPFMQVDMDKALTEAKQNNPEIVQMEVDLIEARSRCSHDKSRTRLDADLFASFGLTQTAANIPGVYEDPQDQQTFQAGISLPLLDWGLGRGRYKWPGRIRSSQHHGSAGTD